MPKWLRLIRSTVDWPGTQALQEQQKRLAIEQFIDKYRLIREVQGNDQHWGDETEYTLLHFDHKKKLVKTLLAAEKLLNAKSKNGDSLSDIWQPEYANFMIEGVPAEPYDGIRDCISSVQQNFKRRRTELKRLLEKPHQGVVTISSFPRTGCPDFCTKNPFLDDFDGRSAANFDLAARRQGHVYLDSLPFGNSCCSLQTTFQTQTETDAKRLYDQLTAFTPIFLALSAATPIFRGFLTDVDCRWQIATVCNDDRSESERDFTSVEYIGTSRHDAVEMYISEANGEYNDLYRPYCNEAYEMLMEAGLDETFARSIALLFRREPMLIPDDNLDNFHSIDYFSRMYTSYNWRTVRLRMPPNDGSSGWKVEFRPTEIQMSDFENSAYAIFVFLLSRVILEEKIDIIMPMSKVFENLQQCQKRDAVLNQHLWFPTKSGLQQLSLNQIINGDQSEGFVGVASLLADWLAQCNQLSAGEKATVGRYIDFVRLRANGMQPTVAKWIRKFVRKHKDYMFDSVVSPVITYDLIRKMIELADTDRR